MYALGDDARKSTVALLLSSAFHAGVLFALSLTGILPRAVRITEPFPLYLGPIGAPGGVGGSSGLGAPAPADGGEGAAGTRIGPPAKPQPAPAAPSSREQEAVRTSAEAVKKSKLQPPTSATHPVLPRPSPTVSASPGAAHGAGAGGAEVVGSSTPGGSGAGGAGAGGTASYEQALAAWLDRHKYYPLSLRRRGIEGDGTLAIRITRAGRVLEVQVIKPFAHLSLDGIAQDCVKRAEPFPPIPASISGDSYMFTVRISFRIE